MSFGRFGANKSLLLSGLVLALGALAAFWLLRPEDLEADAIRVLDAAQTGDVNTLLDYSLEAEKEALGLSVPVAHQLWAELIHPRLEAYRNHKPRESYLELGGHQAVANQLMVSSNDRVNQLPAVVYKSDKGGKTEFMSFLRIAWHFEYFDKHDERMDGITNVRAFLAGLIHDRKRLEELGVPGIYDVDSGKIVTWTELETGYRERLARWEADQSAVEPELQ